MQNQNRPGIGNVNHGVENNSGKGSAQNRRRARHDARRIALIYFVVSLAWIFFTDELVSIVMEGGNTIAMVSILKGMFFILMTSALIYLLSFSSIRRRLDAMEHMLKKDRMYHELHQEYNQSQTLLKTVLQSVPDLVYFKDKKGIYGGCNRAFEDFAGKKEEDIIGKSDYDLFDDQKAAMFQKADLEILESGKAQFAEQVMGFSDGHEAYLETMKSPLYGADGCMSGIIGIARDITERKLKEERIQFLIYHDSLTGLYNRAFFQEEWSRLDRENNLPFSVIVGDVNGLKLINDAFGHIEGDSLLVTVAGILKQCARKDDVVARMGGDEFALLLPDTDSETAKEITERIRMMCEAQSEKSEYRHIQIALGHATKRYETESFEEIHTAAEDIMYRKKLFESQSLRNSILASIKTTMFEKSYETEEHAERLAELSRQLGEAIFLPEEKLDELELLATLHDIGKIGVDTNILTKAGVLTEDDMREIRKHPEIGYRITNSAPELRHISYYILCHHERWDGHGYPQGLSAENIPLLSRIISITDAYDAMTQDRSYRKAMGKMEAQKEIQQNAGTQFDPYLALVFVEQVLPKQNPNEKK